MIYLAQAYRVGRYADPTKEEGWLKAAYQKGSLTALAGLGINYIRQNRMEEAETLLRQGAEEDDGVSIYYLSMIYHRRAKTAEDLFVVKGMLEQSMALGQVRAKNTLGRLLIQNNFGWRRIPKGLALHVSSLIDALRIGTNDPYDPRLW